MTEVTTKNITINLTTLIIVALAFIVLVGCGWMIYSNKVVNLKDKIEAETKLKNALVDSVRFSVNSFNEIVAEKLTLQGEVKDLKDKNNNLSSNERNLLNRVEKAEKENTIITAALIETHVIIDSLSDAKVTIDSLRNSISFKDSTKYIKFDINVANVAPLKGLIKPTITFNKFDLINTQFVDFSWKNNRKEGSPIAFSVSNSNPYFKTFDISSYAIPQLDKKTVKPNFIQRVGISIGKNKVLIIAPVSLVGGYFIGKSLK